MPTGPLYDDLGRTYAVTRREDPRIAAQIRAALGDASTVLNVGAGTGNYEPADRRVTAVEPSLAMIRQRSGRMDRVVRGVAERLPFADGAFDAALAVLTVHHWRDREAGLAELRRVTGRQVILFFQPADIRDFWVSDYFPETRELPSERSAPDEQFFRDRLLVREVRTVLVPWDCVDGFGAAFWGRPEAYLDPVVQAGMSWTALLPPAALARGTARLRRDLESGAWDADHGRLRSQLTCDVGYRLVLAGAG